MVAATPVLANPSDELRCLATATYFEAGRQSPEGQLAVARVIVARSHLARFASTYCGVVFQPLQFTFARHHRLPAVPAGKAWDNALRIAVIADAGQWQSPVEGALYFHAARVRRGLGQARMAMIGGNVFFR